MSSNKDSSPDFDTLMFDERLDKDPLFSEPEPFVAEHIAPLRDKLVHLSRFGNLLIMIIGERGCGKSFLRDQLTDAVQEESDICFIQGQPLFTPDQLFQAIQSEFLTSTTSAIDNQSFQDSLEQEEIPILNRLLVIDDADTLSTEVIRELCALSAAEQEKDSPFVKVLLFANHDLTISIESAATGILPETGIYTIDVPELSDEDARKWVEYALLNQGYQAQSDEIDEIVEQGGNNLNRLHELALDYVDTVPEDELPEEALEEESGVSMMGYWFAGLTLVVLFVLGGFFYQDEISELIFPPATPVAIKEEVIDVSSPLVEADVLETQAIEDTATPINEGIVTEDIDTENIDTQDPIVTDISSTDEQPGLQEEVSETTTEQQTEDSITNTVIGDVAEEAVAEAEQQSQADEIETQVPVEDLTTTEDEALVIEEVVENERIQSAPSITFTEAEQQLLDASESDYVVQIVGLSNPDAIDSLIAEYPEFNLLAYRSLLSGKPWQIVVLGTFQDYQSANQQRNNLPDSLAVNKPWIKSVAKVKQEIRAAVTDTE